jgi:MoaA/NifB/PqqE/SkfB family radical SAM enzyme
MSPWLARVKVAVRTLAYRDAWGFRPRQSLGMLRYLLGTRPTWRDGQAEMNVYSPPVGSAAYPRYLQGLRRMNRGEWVPLVAHVSVTDRCPHRCARCSNIARGGDDPPLESLARLAGQLRAAGACRVALTGGEPMLRADLPAVVEACGGELSPVLFTSGHGLALPQARQLRQAGLAAAYVSLDHFQAQRHDRVRGQAGAFQRAVDAIRACREAGLYTAAQAVVGPSLAEQGRLEQFVAFCEEQGAHEVMLLEELPIRDAPAGAGSDGDLDVQAVRQRLAAMHLRSARDAAMPKVSSMSWLENPDCLGCQAGFSFLYVSAEGEVFPCDFVPLSFGNVHELGIEAIHERMQRVLRRPSSACLARRRRTAYGVTGPWPLSWDHTQAALKDYDPGPAPKLLRYLYHDCKHSA